MTLCSLLLLIPVAGGRLPPKFMPCLLEKKFGSRRTRFWGAQNPKFFVEFRGIIEILSTLGNLHLPGPAFQTRLPLIDRCLVHYG